MNNIKKDLGGIGRGNINRIDLEQVTEHLGALERKW
jgi:hypothetical protein